MLKIRVIVIHVFFILISYTDLIDLIDHIEDMIDLIDLINQIDVTKYNTQHLLSQSYINHKLTKMIYLCLTFK